MIGPEFSGIEFLTRLKNAKRPVACVGTPWSGQEVKWYWVISLVGYFMLGAVWRRIKKHETLQNIIGYYQNTVRVPSYIPLLIALFFI